MSILKITKGPLAVKEHSNKRFDVYAVNEKILGFSGTIVAFVEAPIRPHKDNESDEDYTARIAVEAKANAELFAEAGTVATETGLTPRQLLQQRDELLGEVEKFKRLNRMLNKAHK